MNPSNANAVVVVFTIEGCDACSEYKPRFLKIATQYRNQVPIYILDANSDDPQVTALAQRLRVSNVPATYVLRKPAGLMSVLGGIPDDQIVWLLGLAAREAAHQ